RRPKRPQRSSAFGQTAQEGPPQPFWLKQLWRKPNSSVNCLAFLATPPALRSSNLPRRLCSPMAVPAFDEFWRQDPILVGGVAPPCGANFQRYVPPTFGVILHAPMYSRKVGIVRARTPHPENLNGLQRVVGASAESIASHGSVGAELGGPEFVVGSPAKPVASRGPDSARAS
ncbi:unnamed protein product, partial [Prorocentrum cordatum]